MTFCNGDGHALRVMRSNVSSQQYVVKQQKDILRRLYIQCPLDPNLSVAAADVADIPILIPGEMNINSRLCRFIATGFPEFISIYGSTTLQTVTLRLEPSSATNITPTLDRVVLMDPPRLFVRLTCLRRPASRSDRRSLLFRSSFAALLSSSTSSSTVMTVGEASSSTVSSPISLV